MDSPIPPDPYVALGVTSDADADAIKKAYRKLALKLHPDKCTDESQKAARTDEFTQIQQAYDILGDDDKRRKYDAQVKLAELRRQKMEMRSSAPHRPDVKYNVRMSAPREASYSGYPPPPPRPMYEQPLPRPRHYEDDYEPARGSTRKANVADEYAYVKRPSPRDEKREKVRVTVDPRDDDRRRDAKRREAEVRESRSSKYARDDYDDDRRRKEYDDMRRKADAYDGHSSTERILEERLRDAQRHMDRQTTSRPNMARRESSRQGPTYREREREPEVRRSAAVPKDRERTRESRRTSPSKDERRRAAENVDPFDRRVPNLSTHSSAPPVVESMPPPPPRVYTTPNMDTKKKARDVSPPPNLSRATTQPVDTMPGASSSSRRKETKTRSGDEAGYASNAPSPGFSTTYAYGDERAAPHVSYTNGHRTVLREPTSTSARRTESSPVRPSKGAVKMKGLDPKNVKRTTQYSYTPGAGAQPIIVEPASKSSSRPRVSERDREYSSSYDRGHPQYFGENGAGTIDPRYSHPSSPYDEAPYARHPPAADLRYAAPRSREFEKPSFTRSSTYVY